MSSTGVAIGMTGTGVVLAFLLSPIFTILSIYPVAILGAAVPTTGGPYRYVSRFIGKGVGMIYLLLHITTNVMIATHALSFGSYLVSIVTGLNAHMVAMASKHSDILTRSTMKISVGKAKMFAIMGVVVLCVLSSSLLLSLSAAVIGFLAVLVVITVIYTK